MKVHFIGIGGIGMSALAQYYLNEGWQVRGSDLRSSEITTMLKKKSAEVYIGQHKSENLPFDVNKVIYSLAIPPDNPEFKKAKFLLSNSRGKNFNLQIQSYPEALGELTKQYQSIAIAGTHGKSTTTAMVAKILGEAGFDPAVIIGTKLKEFNDSNFRPGKSSYFVFEADEWKAAFLHYWPKMILLTTIEEEHLDFFKDLNDMLAVYKEFINHLTERDNLVINRDDENIRKLIPSKPKFAIHSYSLKQKEAQTLRNLLKIPGDHNISNALAALTAMRAMKIPDDLSFKALNNYEGAWRRFEIKEVIFLGKNLTLISDYAHHPTEIEATLKAVRSKYPQKKIWVIFQPHQYQRTFYLFDKFVHVFQKDLYDHLIITDIFEVAGRENSLLRFEVSAKKLVKAINKDSSKLVEYWAFDPREIINFLVKNLKGGEVVVIMGAGDIYSLFTYLSE